ncbi:MAG TPA: hypothetical protein VFP72_05935 [Kineosporiaceae bacterium]|nr:hypothetical protein [Kineosporiaceae bacterium]
MTADADPQSLVISARAALADEDLPRAAGLLHDAADGFVARNDLLEAVRCLRMAVSLHRALGDLADAEHAAARAVDLAPARSGAAALARADLHRIQALALLSEARTPDPAAEAVEALRLGAAALQDAGDDAGALRYLVEGVAVVQGGGHGEPAEVLAADALALADAAGDHAALSELAVLASSRAVDAGDLPGARRLTRHARDEALAGRSGPQYLAAAVAESHLAEASDDRAGAYTSLAVAWVTLGDLLGADTARAAVEPLLLDARQRWGAAAFQQARTSYEDRRRAELGRAAPADQEGGR